MNLFFILQQILIPIVFLSRNSNGFQSSKSNALASQYHHNLNRDELRNFHSKRIFARESTTDNSSNTQEGDGSMNLCRGGGVIVGKINYFNAGYMRLLDTYPCRTKSVSAGLVTAIGDILAQLIESKVTGVSFVLNFQRVWAFTIASTIFVGPFVHWIYELLWLIGRRLEKMGISKTWRTIAQVLFDQTVGVWTFFPSYFYVHAIIEALVKNKLPDFAHVQNKISKELVSVIISNYKLWPVVNYINFTYVPENLRVLVSNIVSILWNAYLCTRMAS